jgi:Ca2+-binding EF-hand superfamily protein
MADTDGGGDISKKELLRYLPALGIQPNETTVDKYMKEFGVKDKLTFEQFALVAAKLKLE